MYLNAMFSLLCCVVLCASVGVYAQGQRGDLGLWLVFAPQEDWQAWDKAWNRARKSRFVYERLEDHARRTQADCQTWLRGRGLAFRSYHLVNAIYLPQTPSMDILEVLAARPDVLKIMPNAPLRQAEVWETALRRDASIQEWAVHRLGVPSFWARGHRGQGVRIGGQDTGYDWIHPAIQNSYEGWSGGLVGHDYYWHDAIREPSPLHSNPNNPCGFDLRQPCDDGFHGTHTMGSMVGDGGETRRFGLAPEARWIGCRNMDRGWGSLATYLECFEWFLAPTDLDGQNPRPEQSPDVINNSWGCPPVEGCNPDNFALMAQAIEHLERAGVLVVVSAGNDGPDCESLVNPAAIFESALVVGASGPDDRLAWFSSRGPVSIDGSYRMKPDLVAPGQAIYSAATGNRYVLLNGTSMAGPHVAGLAALMLSAKPEWSGQVDLLKHILKQTAISIELDAQNCGGLGPDVWPNYQAGYGRINAQQALNWLDRLEQGQGQLQVHLYPNPVQSQAELWLQSPHLRGKLRLEWFNFLGQTILSNEVNNVQTGLKIPQKPQNSGTYLLRIQELESQKTQSIIVQIRD